MIVVFHASFKKRFRKLPPKVREAFYARMEIFLLSPHHPLLHDHSVGRAYPRHRSINITGDVRALYTGSADRVIFMLIGTHAELYG